MDENVKKQIAEEVVRLAGGIDNFKSCGTCATRVRFTLVDEKKANLDALKKIPNTYGCVRTFGQYQVIVGVGDNKDIADIIKQQMETKKK